MPAPTVTLHPALATRLAAARHRLHVTTDWVEPGSADANGRAFGFWRVRAGPEGWQKRPPYTTSYYTPTPLENPGPCTSEDADLIKALVWCLDTADRLWPIR